MENDVERRCWDTTNLIAVANHENDRAHTCQRIINDAIKHQRWTIVMSSLASVEFVRRRGSAQLTEAQVRDLETIFKQPNIEVKDLSLEIADNARLFVLKYQDYAKLRPNDAVHLATAINVNASVLETYDEELLRLDGIADVKIRKPEWMPDNPRLL